MAANDLRAPFNFIPLSPTVYYPKWWRQISQDIPFSDGISGSIDITITAKSPIFVRNGHSTEDLDSVNSNSFCKTDDGRYFIPGTSIKGMVRNVLEIMSFSKITVDQHAMFAQREWHNDKLYTLKKNQADIRCGYLRKKYDTESEQMIFELEDHGKPMRIGFDEIDNYLCGNLFQEHFSKKPSYDINSSSREYNDTEYDPRTAAFKYALAGAKPLCGLRFSKSDKSTKRSVRLKVDSSGSIEGDIVMTGQPNRCKWERPKKLDSTAGKFYEFVFPSNIQKIYPVSDETFRHFEFIYSSSSERERYRELLEKQGIPVFFRTEGNAIKDFGLAYLYKLPYERSPYNTLPESHKKNEQEENEPDLAECIFGRISKNGSLKGRVHFSNAFLQNSNQEPQEEEVKLCLASPKASYYPIYIQQKGRNYLTYNDGCISGWKRYHVRKGTWQKSIGNKLDTIIRPLKANSVFKCRMAFHNLRPIELGALLSAITFHDTPECFHQIGQAKPFGYGKVVMTIVPESLNDIDVRMMMTEFEQAMETNGFPGWANSEQITELFTLCHEQVDANDHLYQYMEMSNEKGKNEFIEIKSKDTKNYLHHYTEKLNAKFHPKSLSEQAKSKDLFLENPNRT